MAKPPVAHKDPYYQKLHDLLTTPQTDAQLFDAVVNAPFHDMLKATQYDLGITVLLLANHEKQTIDRVALSNTYSAQGAVRMSAVPFKKIKIPLDHTTNLISQAIATGKPQQTEDWRYLFVPALTAQEAHFNQAGAGIECSIIYPLHGKRAGAMIFSYYQPASNIGAEHHKFMKYYIQLVSERI